MDSTETDLPAPTVLREPERRTLSALICNYNHAEYLETAINAVLMQTRRPDELLLMDDGSTDGSAAIMRRYAEKHSFIKVFRKERNEGYIKGIQQLTALAKGDYIHRGASDDSMLACCVEELMGQAERHPEAGIVSGVLLNLYEADGRLDILNVPGWDTGFIEPERYRREYLEAGDPRRSLAPSTIFRRDVVDALGGWRDDLDSWEVTFLLHAAALKHGMCYVNRPVYTWLSRPSAWTHQTIVNLDLSTAVYARFYALMRSDPFRDLFGELYPQAWLTANLLHSADSIVRAIIVHRLSQAQGN